jgi:ligand-binding sensor domain-containing protein
MHSPFHRISLLLVFFSSALLTSCSGQPESEAVQSSLSSNEQIQQFDNPLQNRGLQISEFIVELFEDSQGNIWMGTMSDGVARYNYRQAQGPDAKPLAYYSVPDGLVNITVPTMAEDRNGKLWFGTHDGISTLQLSDANTTNTLSFTEITNPSSSPGQFKENWVSVNKDRKGNIWLNTVDKPYKYDGKEFKVFEVPVDMSKISSYYITKGRVSFKLEDSHSNLWFAVEGYGVFKYDGKEFTHLTKKDGLCSMNISNIIEDEYGDLWFACLQSQQPQQTGDGGLCVFDGKTFKTFPNEPGLQNNDIYTLYQAPSGMIWIGAIGHGVYTYDGTTFKLYDKTDRPDLMKRFGLQSALEDSKGIMWLGFSGGLFRLQGDSMLNVTKDGPWD